MEMEENERFQAVELRWFIKPKIKPKNQACIFVSQVLYIERIKWQIVVPSRSYEFGHF